MVAKIKSTKVVSGKKVEKLAEVVADPKKQKDVTTDIFGSVLTFTFANGKSVEIDAEKLSPEMRQQALMHGLKQKLGDGAAIQRNETTGLSATIDDKFNAVEAIANRVKAGEWKKVGRDAGAGQSGLLIRALMVLYPKKTKEQLQTYLDSLKKEQQAALRVTERVSSVIATFKKDLVAKGDELLSELEGE